MTKVRGFEVAKGFENEEINLPKRSTKGSAGYDFESAEDIVIPSVWKQVISSVKDIMKEGWNPFEAVKRLKEQDEKRIKPTLVKTGVKAYMGEDEVLKIYNRSSNPLKRFLLLANGVGIIDSDYYNNPDNDGHIMVQFINFGIFPKQIRKGDKIAQGIFMPYLKADNDVSDKERTGGFGSTWK